MWGIVQGPDPRQPSRLLLRGEDGGTYFLAEHFRHWPGTAPAQCLTVGSSVCFLLPFASDSVARFHVDLRLPEHHPDWEVLRGLRPGQRIEVLSEPWRAEMRLAGAPRLLVQLRQRDQPAWYACGQWRRLRAVVLGVDGAVIHARLTRSPSNWGWRRWRRDPAVS